jgi:D-amino-acid dehydrogenase
VSEHAPVLVIGGGIVGVSAAWFLAERGARVTLLEKGEVASGCSYGNAGWIFPSHSMPIPRPGVPRHALRFLGDSRSPLYVRPRLDRDFLRFGARFAAACRAERAQRSFRLRRELAVASHALYDKLAALPELDLGYRQCGLLVVCEGEEALAEARAEAELLRELGGEAKLLAEGDVRDLVPLLCSPVSGGVHFPADAHLVPDRAVRSLAQGAARRGVDLRPGVEVLELGVEQGRVRRVETNRGSYTCDELVLAAGAWSTGLARSLGLRLLVEPAKGYSVTVSRPEGFGEVPVMLAEAKVGVTPLEDRVRFAGTLELGGLDLAVLPERLAAVREAVARALPPLAAAEPLETWRGLRPLTPDDLPVIGRPRGLTNVVVATGHGMSGMCQGPITGELVAQLVHGEKPSLDLAPFSPDRF